MRQKRIKPVFEETILPASDSVRSLIAESKHLFEAQNMAYCYVYLHKVKGIVLYVGMGSYDRAVRVHGRSQMWYKNLLNQEIEVEIVEYFHTRESAERLEQEYIALHTDTVVNYQHIDYRNKPVVQFSREGEIIRVFRSVHAVSEEGFLTGCVYQCCEGKRGIHRNFIWMYQETFTVEGFKAKTAANHSRMIVQYDKNGNKIRNLLTAAAFEEFGFSAKIIQQVCANKKKTHLGFVFKYEQPDTSITRAKDQLILIN